MLVLAAALLLQAASPYVVAREPVIALTNVRIIDGTGAPAREGQTIVIRDGKISAMGPTASTAVPAGAAVRDLTGKTVIPGLVMLHEHLFYVAGGGAYPTHSESFPRLYLAGGVTTMRTAGNMGGYTDFNVKRVIDAGQAPGPDIHVTAPYFNGPGLPIPGVKGITDAADAVRMAEYWAAEGATSFKTYMQISRAELAAVVSVAHARGIKVTGHLCSVTYREAADLGIDNLEHGFFASTDFAPNKAADQCPGGNAGKRALAARPVSDPEVQALLRHLVARGVSITSTPTVFETSVPGQPKAPIGALEAMLPQARESYARNWERIGRDTSGTARREYQRMRELEREFVRLGGRLVVGPNVTPLRYRGRLTQSGSYREYRVTPALEGLRAALIDFLVEAFGAERLPVEEGDYSREARIGEAIVHVSWREEDHHVGVWMDRGSDSGLVATIAERFDAALRTGRFDHLFGR